MIYHVTLKLSGRFGGKKIAKMTKFIRARNDKNRKINQILSFLMVLEIHICAIPVRQQK